MTIKVNHKFRSQKADTSDSSLIRPSNWNEQHTITMTGPAIMARTSVGEGDVQEITLGGGLVFIGTSLHVDNANAATLAGQPPSFYTNIPARLGFTPVISANPGRIQMHWGADGAPYMIVDGTFVQLATNTQVAAAQQQATNAAIAVNTMFNNIRLSAYGQTYESEVPSGCVMVGGVFGAQSLKVYRQIQGFSPTRGWVAATND